MFPEIQPQMSNGHDLLAIPDEIDEENVSTTTPPEPGGISGWQPLTIRETVILLIGVAGFVFQWAQMSTQMSAISRDVAGVHQDIATIGLTLRSHMDAPGHPIELERAAMTKMELDDIAARLKALELVLQSHRR